VEVTGLGVDEGGGELGRDPVQRGGPVAGVLVAQLVDETGVTVEGQQVST
jgi:hypothetical protein